MKIINKILCNTVHAICATADFIGTVVGSIIKGTVLSALALSSMVAIALLWMSIPVGICRLIFGELDKPITSQSEAAGILIVIAVWVVITKIALDWCDRRRNKTPLDKFFEKLNKKS